MNRSEPCCNWMQLQDHECVELFQSGEQDAFAELVRRYQNRVFRFLLRLTGCREEALELTQDTMIKALRALDGWRPDTAFATWLFRIANNAATDRLRRRGGAVAANLQRLSRDLSGRGRGQALPAPDEETLRVATAMASLRGEAGLPRRATAGRDCAPPTSTLNTKQRNTS